MNKPGDVAHVRAPTHHLAPYLTMARSVVYYPVGFVGDIIEMRPRVVYGAAPLSPDKQLDLSCACSFAAAYAALEVER